MYRTIVRLMSANNSIIDSFKATVNDVDAAKKEAIENKCWELKENEYITALSEWFDES